MPNQAGNAIKTAFDIGTVNTNVKIFEDTVSTTAPLGYYKFTIAENSKLDLKLSGLSQNADLFLRDYGRGTLVKSQKAGNTDETISTSLRAGTYYAYVESVGNATNYKFEAVATPIGAVPVDNAGDSFERAKSLGTLSTTAIVANDFLGNFNGLITDAADFYRFTISENSTVNLKLSGLNQNVDLGLFDSQGSSLQSSAATGNADENITKNLRSGTYYITTGGGGNGTNYQLSASAVSLGAIPIDTAGSSFARAKNIGTLGATAIVTNEFLGNFNGFVTDNIDYYQFTLAENSTVNLKVSGLSQNVGLYLNGSQEDIVLQASDKPGNADETISRNLRAGTYFAYVNGGGSGTNYQFTANAVSLGSTLIDAKPINNANNLGTLGTVLPTVNDSVNSSAPDYYKFTLTDNSTVNLKLTGLSQDATLQLLDNNGSGIVTASKPGTADENITANLRANTYYLQVSGGGAGTNYKLDANATSLNYVDNAGQTIDEARDLGTLTATVRSSTDFVGNFNELASDPEDFYKFTLAEDSTVTLKLSDLSQTVTLLVLNSNANPIPISIKDDQGKVINNNAVTVFFSPSDARDSISQIFKAGTYYIKVSSSDSTGTNYKLDASAVSSIAPIDNAGQTIDYAKDLGTITSTVLSSTDFIGTIDGVTSDTADFYKFTLTENSIVDLKLSGLNQDAVLRLLSSNGIVIKTSDTLGAVKEENIIQNLKAGTYHILVSGGDPGTVYKLDASAISLNPLLIDNAGQTIDTAKNLGTITSSGLPVTDFIGDFDQVVSDDDDFYKFTLAENSLVNLKLSGLNQNANLELLTGDGTFIAGSGASGAADENIARNLRAGNYYVLVLSGSPTTIFGTGTGTTYKVDLKATPSSPVTIPGGGSGGNNNGGSGENGGGGSSSGEGGGETIVTQTPQLIQPQPNILSIAGGTEKSLLKFTKISQEGSGKNEAFAFIVDDEQGRIGGIAPGTAGYLTAALDRAQVIFSNLSNSSIDRGLDRDAQRYLNITPGDRVQFGLVVDDSIDSIKAALAVDKPTPKVLFSLPGANANNSSQTNFTALPNNGGYQIAWTNSPDDGKTNRVFNDMILKVETIDTSIPSIGTNLQTKSEGSLIDLRGFTGQIKVDTVSVSDAAYNNYIGFYAVEDALGTLANGLKVGDAGYAEAAIKNAVLRSSKTETILDRSLTGGKIFAPVMVANGTFDDFLNRNPQNQANRNINAYFNYLGANPDKVDHFRLLGDNKFGVEDLYGGGDRDYNDIVFELKFPALAG